MEENPYAAPAGGPESLPEGGESTEARLRPMSQQERLGRRLVAVAIAITLFGDGLVIGLEVAHSGVALSGSSFIRWFLTAALLYAVWQGHRWARWLTVALMGLGLTFLLWALVQNMHPLLLGVAVQMGATFAILAFPKSVTAFLTLQRTRRTRAPT